MNLQPVIASLKTGTYTVTRSALWLGASHYDSSGVLVRDDDPSTFPIDAVVTPVSGANLMRLPDGFATKDLRQVLTATALHAKDETHGGDTIAIDGDSYAVQDPSEWPGFGQYIVARVGA